MQQTHSPINAFAHFEQFPVICVDPPCGFDGDRRESLRRIGGLCSAVQDVTSESEPRP